MRYPKTWLCGAVAATLTSSPHPAIADENTTPPEIEEIVVTADYRQRDAAALPSALTLLDRESIEAHAVQHFEELTAIVPNLNWSGDGHRARYFQIRGVGELEQYQGAPNPSVGLLIDDIDFSGIGTIATLFDIERVEVLRGPQGSRYGANALGGLIYIRSRMPTAARAGRVQLGLGDDDSMSAGFAFGGAIGRDAAALYRFSAHHHRSNGFRSNPYLGRDDSNRRRETSVRGRMSFDVTEWTQIDVAALFADVDNGYDAFALDNSYTVLSDKPGRDAQRSLGASFKVRHALAGGGSLTWLATAADSDIDFDFDADWGNDDAWAPFLYDFISRNDRGRTTVSQELRIESAPDSTLTWLAGLYALRLEDGLRSLNAGDYDDGVFPFSLFAPLESEFEATSIAVFAHVERRLGSATRLGAGIRTERRSTDYRDTDGLSAAPSDTMAGGELSLSHEHSESTTSFVSLSRGYKAGGFNLGLVPDALREFREEAIWNLEAGIRHASGDGAWNVSASAFVSDRVDQQLRLSFQLNPNDPASFGFATVNADGTTRGLEASIDWSPGDAWQVYASIGVLDATIDGFDLPGFAFAGRAQAHAPRYTFAAGARYRHTSGWFARVDVSGRDAFYFDVSHDQKSSPYELTDIRIGYESDRWSATLWVRNLFDRMYAVRGFYFGNEPPNFEPALYTRLGDPRHAGLTIERRFGE